MSLFDIGNEKSLARNVLFTEKGVCGYKTSCFISRSLDSDTLGFLGH